MSYDEHLISMAGGDGELDLDAKLDSLMAELVAREDRWKKAWEMEELTHDEAVSATQEDRWVYAQLAAIRAAITEASA